MTDIDSTSTSVDDTDLTGLERAQPAALARRSPINARFGIEPLSADEGTSVFALSGAVLFTDREPRRSSAILSLLADATMGNAALTVMAPGQASNTGALRMEYVGTWTPGRRVLADTWVAGGDGTTLLTQGELRYDDGALIAVASSRCFIVPAVHNPSFRTGAPGSPTVPTDNAGLHLGLARLGAEAGSAELVTGELRPFSNVFGAVHGGMVSALLEQGTSEAAENDAGLQWAKPSLMDLSIRYLRPVSATSGSYTISARTLQRSRRQVVVAAEIRSAERVHATAEAAYLAGPPTATPAPSADSQNV